MPYLRRRRLRSTSRSSRYYRRYRRYRRYPRLLRRVSYANGRDYSTCNLKVVTNNYSSGNINPGTNDSIVFVVPSFQRSGVISGFSGYLGNCGCVNSALYRAYTSLYEEVRLRGVSYEISVTNPMGVGGTMPSFLIFASVDRRWRIGDNVPTNSQLANFASITPSSYVNYNKTKFKKYVAARDLIEKTQYHDCTVRWIGDSFNFWEDVAASDDNININFFSPALFFFVRFPFAPSAALQLQFTVRVVFYFTFRNPAPFETVPTIPAGSAAAAAVSAAASVPFDGGTIEGLDEDPDLLAGRTTPLLVPT